MKCHICQQEFDEKIQSRKHIFLIHKWKTKTYYDTFLKRENEEKCLYCNNKTQFISLSKGYRSTCNKHSFIISQQKIKEKYGISNISQLDTIKEKKKQTCLKNHGTEFSFQNEKCKQKTKKTLLNKYGVNNASKSPEVIDKIKKTMIFRYAHKHALQIKKFKNKFQNTCIEKFGVSNPLQNQNIIKKVIETSKKKHGGMGFGSNNINQKIKETLLKKYGEDNFSKTLKGKIISRLNYIKLIEKSKLNGEPLSPRIGNAERESLNDLQKHTKFNIIRNNQELGHSIGCFPDGFIKELNLAIEFDENWHSKKFQISRDIIKDRIYRLNNISVFRIKQKDWEQNKNQIIKKFEENMKRYISDQDSSKKEKTEVETEEDKKKKESEVTKNDLGLTENAKIIME